MSLKLFRFSIFVAKTQQRVRKSSHRNGEDFVDIYLYSKYEGFLNTIFEVEPLKRETKHVEKSR